MTLGHAGKRDSTACLDHHTSCSLADPRGHRPLGLCNDDPGRRGRELSASSELVESPALEPGESILRSNVQDVQLAFGGHVVFAVAMQRRINVEGIVVKP